MLTASTHCDIYESRGSMDQTERERWKFSAIQTSFCHLDSLRLWKIVNVKGDKYDRWSNSDRNLSVWLATPPNARKVLVSCFLLRVYLLYAYQSGSKERRETELVRSHGIVVVCIDFKDLEKKKRYEWKAGRVSIFPLPRFLFFLLSRYFSVINNDFSLKINNQIDSINTFKTKRSKRISSLFPKVKLKIFFYRFLPYNSFLLPISSSSPPSFLLRDFKYLRSSAYVLNVFFKFSDRSSWTQFRFERMS